MGARKGDMTLTEANRLMAAIEDSVADRDCDCEYCMSEKMYAIDKAKRIKAALVAIGYSAPESDPNDH